ncbi:DUF2399 domain-containing protein [Burkholderia cenocepacia]|uniref:Wadjet anti-phage system protein JetD domain-containing protein n=1 Tax=Burkholderia cenocepacia TaxID=95486 RepID=UPI0015888B33|nr:Wadjet anti-phage system protein JetD domain-containing protein [Burkholderia cenocepacia]MBR8380490.1 DUF2399 domain-containing protein [Burkholderia cenocepacia]MBR8415062.1 DUF2399 domain-containing protein [Burkholderia cenocepacia]MCA8238983.1 DUF2220 family protein [Burkholderia cenocepacia]MDS0849636.1 DUF2220 family protein [Burkholderia cenocepacia]
MDTLAVTLLSKLLTSGEQLLAGRRTRGAALTATALKPYLDSRSLLERESFEATIHAATDAGAVELTYERGQGSDRSIIRITLLDVAALATFLGRPTLRSILEVASALLANQFDSFPVLRSVFSRWERLFKVRGIGPDRAVDWVDAAAIITYMNQDARVHEEDLPIREVSAKLFLDSKRIEQLAAPLDVLLSGDIDAEPRTPSDVWAEIGLRREDQPVRLAGAVVVRRQRVSALLDSPYGAFPAATVLGLDGTPELVLTIENQTTFHSEAKRRADNNVLLIYTAGMPSPAWRAMYGRLLAGLPSGTPVLHWGDIDEGGFRIAANLAEIARHVGHVLQPYRMSPVDIPRDRRRPAASGQIDRMRAFAVKAGWSELADLLAQSEFTAEQEVLD